MTMQESPSARQLASIQARFHELIRYRATEEFGLTPSIELPVLTADLGDNAERLWFPVPGMYGGLTYQLAMEGDTLVLRTESWSRVVGGSGQAHRITESGTELVDEGFV
jgi:hypothetical protein